MLNKITLADKALEYKQMTLNMCCNGGTGHVNSSFSLAELLATLYEGGILRHDPKDPDWDDRDRLILSKGQASPILYTVLADRGYFPHNWLNTFNHPDGKFAVHLQNTVPGVELSTGSLGHGLGVATGMAISLKLNRKLPLVFCILGDAECYEGSVWESALLAAHQHLNNLIAFVDRNYLGATDFTENACALEPLEDKWKAFGWDTARINGHDPTTLITTLGNYRARLSRKPRVIILDTVKGNGVDFLENAPLWHSRTPDSPNKALSDLRRNHR